MAVSIWYSSLRVLIHPAISPEFHFLSLHPARPTFCFRSDKPGIWKERNGNRNKQIERDECSAGDHVSIESQVTLNRLPERSSGPQAVRTLSLQLTHSCSSHKPLYITLLTVKKHWSSASKPVGFQLCSDRVTERWTALMQIKSIKNTMFRSDCKINRHSNFEKGRKQ